MKDVKIVRLQTGEDIIAGFREDDATGEVILTEPMCLFFKRLPSGKSMMMISPWLPLEIIDGNFAVLFGSDILTVMHPKKSLVSYYNNVVNETTLEALDAAKDIEESLLNSVNDLADLDFSDNETLEEDDDESIDLDSLMTESKKQTIH